MIEIDEKDYGKEFIEALNEVLKVRKNKRVQYKDEYLTDSLQFLVLTLENKLKRLKGNIENGILKDSDINTENATDSCIDACNYSLFLIAKIMKGDTQ